MKNIFCGEAGETMSPLRHRLGGRAIPTSIYAPLIAGMTTILYEGVPIGPTPASGGRSCRTTRST